MGMFLRSFDATGELDSAQYFVDKYFKKYPKQHLIKNELGYIPDSIKRIKYYKEKIAKKDSKVIGAQGEQGNWMVQVGAFGKRNNAVNLKEKLIKGGYSVSINTLTSNKRTLFAVRAGPFKSRQSAKNKGQELYNLYRLDYQLLNIEK
jgi:cell division protein FtsN